MMDEKVTNIAIIGAGEESILILHALAGLKNFKVAGIADENPAAPAIKTARELKIEVFSNFKDLITKGALSLVIETSGSASFAETLQEIVPKETIVLGREAGKLLVSLSIEREHLLKVETAYKLSEKYAEMIEGTNRKLDEKVLELTLLNEASKTLSTAFDKRNVPSFVSVLLRRKIDFDVCLLLVSDEEGENLILSSEFEIKEDLAQELKFRMVERYASLTRQKLDAQKIHTIMEKSEGRNKTKGILEGEVRGLNMAPLIVFDKILGILATACVKNEICSPENEQFLNILAGHVALFIENDRIRTQIVKEKNQLESILHNMVEGVVVVNPQNNIILVNEVAAELFGISRSEAFGKPISEAVADEKIISLFEMCFCQKTGFITKEIEIINRRDGLPRILSTGLSSIYNISGDISGVILVMHDITKEKEVDRLKSEFISITSHELRTPLASINQAIYLVLSGTAGPINDQQKKFLDIGKRNVVRLGSLINDLLDLSKIEAGKLQLERSEEDINHIIREVILTFEPSAKEKGLMLDEKLNSDLAKFYFDPNKISQVVANLVSNAIKFTPEGGKITLTSSYYGSDPNYIQISVEDSGMGILKEDFDKLFKKFQQLDMALNRKIGGTGLGLSICKQIIELHGGRIWTESEGRGKGAKFIFILPKEETTMDEAKKKKIIVIDDEKDLLDTVEATLIAKNYTCFTALSGQEGLDKIAQSKPDLIILDLMMPTMDGFAVAEKLKKNPETNLIPIIVLTALDQEESAKKALAIGAKGYLVKPFEPDALLFTIHEFLK